MLPHFEMRCTVGVGVAVGVAVGDDEGRRSIALYHHGPKEINPALVVTRRMQLPTLRRPGFWPKELLNNRDRRRANAVLPSGRER